MTMVFEEGSVLGLNENIENEYIETSIDTRNTIDINEGLVGYWSFDFENAEDESGNNHHGIIYEAILVDGISGKAMNFDGIDDYISLPDFTSSLDIGSVTAWVQTMSEAQMVVYGEGTATTIKPYILLGKYDGGQMWFARDIYGMDSNYYGYTEVDMNDGEWHHAVWISEGSGNNNRFYFDGNEITLNWQYEQNPYGIWFDDQPTNTNAIGKLDRDIAQRHWDGLIDEVRIYDRVLSGDDVKELYNNPAGLQTKFLFGQINGLNRDVGNLITFEASKLRCIEFSPLQFNKYMNNEKVKVSKEYIGLLGQKFVIGFFNINL